MSYLQRRAFREFFHWCCCVLLKFLVSSLELTAFLFGETCSHCFFNSLGRISFSSLYILAYLKTLMNRMFQYPQVDPYSVSAVLFRFRMCLWLAMLGIWHFKYYTVGTLGMSFPLRICRGFSLFLCLCFSCSFPALIPWSVSPALYGH